MASEPASYPDAAPRHGQLRSGFGQHDGSDAVLATLRLRRFDARPMIAMNRMFLRAATAAWLCTAALVVSAAEPRPGTYDADGGAGQLTVSKKGAGLRFAIEALGANGHTCTLDGALRAGVGTTEDGGSGICRVAIRPKDGGYDVESLTPDACRAWCGARASFDNVYRPMPPQCSASRYQARHAEFLRLYKAKRYDAALAVATALRSECGRWSWFADADALANDIAITQYHLKRPADCIATLKATTGWEFRTLDDVREGLPPVEADSYESVARSTITNRRLCEAALKRRR